MISIEVDADVFQYLQGRAKPFVDTPNSVLRRELLDFSSIGGNIEVVKETDDKKALLHSVASRKKAHHAKLRPLVRASLLANGQKLNLVDYRGNRVGQYCATVSGGNLAYEGQAYSMSALACLLLQEVGHSSNSVRGSVHWVTDDGTTIWDLWVKHVAERSHNAAKAAIVSQTTN